MSQLPEGLLTILVCPRCRRRLQPEPEALRCDRCRVRYPVVDGIPMLRPVDAVSLAGGSEGESVS